MKWLNHIPLFRLIVPFSLGIMWSFYHPTPVDANFFLAIAALLLSNLILLRLRALHSNYYNRWVFGTLVTAFFFLIGLTLSNSRIEAFNPNHFSNFISPETHPSAYIGTVASEPEIKPNSIKTILEITKIKRNGEWETTSGKCLVYFKQNQGTSIKYGDQISFLKTPSNIEPPANFDEFDYKRYLAHHYVYQRLYLAASDFQLIGFQPIWVAKEKAINWRNFLLKRYQDYGIDGEELAIISALTLGKKESITPELKSAYSSAGAMHVLAVSGLHVGIIFFVLRFLFSWMDKLKNGIAIKAVILILSIWLYAFVTGLSPSVIRASTMFSFMIVAISFKRTSNIYNTLALSAFAILMYEPFMLLEVGFQLSYLAVIGIIYLHPYLYALIELPPGLMEKAWNITCVSLSAQLVTAPLGILYFHQFPTYFLFSNLIVIPAAFLIIFMAIGFQILSVIPFVGELIAFFLKWIIFSLNWLVKAMQQLPNALISGLDITVLETWFMYLIIGFGTVWLTQYNRKFMLYSLAVILALIGAQTLEKWELLHQKEITFYNTGKQPSIEYVNGQRSLFIADTNLLTDADKMQFYVYHHRWKRGLQTNHLEATEEYINIAVLGNTKTLTVDNHHLFTAKQVETFHPDILYFNTYKYKFVNELSKLSYKPIIIIGVGTSRKTAKMLKEYCQINQWEYYAIREDGAVKVLLTEDLKPKEFTHQKHH